MNKVASTRKPWKRLRIEKVVTIVIISIINELTIRPFRFGPALRAGSGVRIRCGQFGGTALTECFLHSSSVRPWNRQPRNCDWDFTAHRSQSGKLSSKSFVSTW